jgi:Tol biopolymer transport system component
MDSTGENPRQLTFGGVLYAFDWSPTGEKIVYTRYKPDVWSKSNGVLWIIDLKSGTETQLTFNP